MKTFEELMKEVCSDGIPEGCKSCDVYQYGMSASYCNDCDGPKQFGFDFDEEIDWGE